MASPLTLSWDQIERLAGTVGDVGALVEGARGEAVPLRALLDLVDLDPAATRCHVFSSDRSYSASIPLDDAVSGGWLAFRLDGQPLPTEFGGPFRLSVAQGTTLCWNVKDVAELRLTAEKQPDSVPERPTH